MDGAEVEAELQREGIELAPGALLTSARIVTSGDVTQTKAYREGRVFIQDEASQLVAALVGKGSRLLDCCAAPGSKTAAIAARNPAAEIIAVELHPHRAELLRRRVRAANVQVITADALQLTLRGGFDRVLADVPCSGTGTLARNPEIKWRLKPADLGELHAKQVAILRAALQQLAPGGRAVYSTCSLEPEENQAVVEEVLQNDSRFTLLDCRAELEALQEQRRTRNPRSRLAARWKVSAHDSRCAPLRRLLRRPHRTPKLIANYRELALSRHFQVHSLPFLHPLPRSRNVFTTIRDARGQGLRRVGIAFSGRLTRDTARLQPSPDDRIHCLIFRSPPEIGHDVRLAVLARRDQHAHLGRRHIHSIRRRTLRHDLVRCRVRQARDRHRSHLESATADIDLGRALAVSSEVRNLSRAAAPCFQPRVHASRAAPARPAPAPATEFVPPEYLRCKTGRPLRTPGRWTPARFLRRAESCRPPWEPSSVARESQTA